VTRTAATIVMNAGMGGRIRPKPLLCNEKISGKLFDF
jgi:hypothetical protein